MNAFPLKLLSNTKIYPAYFLSAVKRKFSLSQIKYSRKDDDDDNVSDAARVPGATGVPTAKKTLSQEDVYFKKMLKEQLQDLIKEKERLTKMLKDHDDKEEGLKKDDEGKQR